MVQDPPQDHSPQSDSRGRNGMRSPQLPPGAKRSRSAARLIAIPMIAAVAALLYWGLHDRFFLPACDSDRAKRTLADILKQLKL